MTDPRKSVAIALEVGEFGGGAVNNENEQPVMPGESGGIFYALPPGAWSSHSNEFKAESIYATGSKLRETAAYGQFSGSWTLKFIMDYEHTEVLDLIYDNHTVSTAVSGVVTKDGESVYDHSWSKDNSLFIKPFVIREKILNRIANKWNPDVHDEVVYLKGCIVKSFKITRSAQGSQMQLEMSGMFADMEVQLADLSKTDYTAYDNTIGPTQYSCMFLDGIDADNYVRDVDSHSISIDTGATLVYNTCTPFATSYFEGQNVYSWDARTYANDPVKKFQLRPFSGGVDATHLKPMSKGLAPMKQVDFITYNLSYRDDPTLDDIVDAWEDSPYRIGFTLIDSTVNAMSWSDGEGEKITDTLQSVECTKVLVTIRNTHPTKNWSNLICDDGTGDSYTPITSDMLSAKLRPTVSSKDTDLGYTTGAALTFDMATGKYIEVYSSDLNRAKLFKKGTAGTAVDTSNSYNVLEEGWIPIGFDSALYNPPSGGPATLEELLKLTSAQATALVNDGQTLTVNWRKKTSGAAITDNNITTYEDAGYYPTTTLSGNLSSTPGTYKHYMIKCHLVDSGNSKVLVVEDRGILRIDISAAQ